MLKADHSFRLNKRPKSTYIDYHLARGMPASARYLRGSCYNNTPQKMVHTVRSSIILITIDRNKKKNYLPQKAVTFTTRIRNTLFSIISNIHTPHNIHHTNHNIQPSVTFTTIERNIFIIHTVCAIDFAYMKNLLLAPYGYLATGA